ncbi:MAG: (d)CMP kinase [Anaerohalosphaeraceae bacterium]|nr:(d)CMP kinase [Anaerohalosphaeraceae bacterium]
MAELVITIDGPAGSGKSSVARRVAEKIGAAFLDTGAMYRAATLAAMNKDVSLTDSEAVGGVIEAGDFVFDIQNGQMVAVVDGVDVSEEIRSEVVTNNVRYVASAAFLRKKIVKMQRAFAAAHEKIVAEGRDQGTVVFTDAEYKFFLTADPAERAKRRAKELGEKNVTVDLQKLSRQMAARDESDSTRKVSPLIPAADAVIIDTTNLTLEGVVEEILKTVGS